MQRKVMYHLPVLQMGKVSGRTLSPNLPVVAGSGGCCQHIQICHYPDFLGIACSRHLPHLYLPVWLWKLPRWCHPNCNSVGTPTECRKLLGHGGIIRDSSGLYLRVAL